MAGEEALIIGIGTKATELPRTTQLHRFLEEFKCSIRVEDSRMQVTRHTYHCPPPSVGTAGTHYRQQLDLPFSNTHLGGLKLDKLQEIGHTTGP